MNLDLSLTSLSPSVPPDLAGGISGPTDKAKIEKAARAVEGLFAGQLMAELGKGMTGDSKEASYYQDFIQQAMGQQVVAGGGFGLAHMLESYLDKTPAPPTGPEATPQELP